MATINFDQKWLYLCEPHTASRYTSKLLQQGMKGSSIGHHHISVDKLTYWRRNHVSIRQLHGFMIFTNVRNPFDVLINRWKTGPMRSRSFRQFFGEYYRKPVLDEPMMGLWREANNFIYYEHLDEDLEWVFGQPLKMKRDMSHHQKGKDPWWTYYQGNFDIVKYLINKYSGFLDKFGYSYHYIGGRLHCMIDYAKRRENTRPLVDVRF